MKNSHTDGFKFLMGSWDATKFLFMRSFNNKSGSNFTRLSYAIYHSKSHIRKRSTI